MARIKQGILVIVGCLVSMLANPLILAADDHFAAKSPDFQAAETVLAERSDDEEDDTPVTAEPVAYATALRGSVTWPERIATKPEVVAKTPETVTVRNYNVTINLVTREQYVAVSGAPSYSDIYRFGKLIFAHNTPDLFGTLTNLGVGETINLTEDGATRPYRVTAVTYYDKTETGLNGDPLMVSKLANNALGHDAALMTCAGVMYGNGDASQRLVVFVDAL